MHKLFRSLLLLACLSIIAAMSVACVPATTPVPPTAAPSNAITNIVWQWTSLTNRTTDETTEVANPENYTLTLRDDGTLNGQADCNSFSGTYSQENGFVITLGPMTLVACGEGSLDAQYLELLGAIAAGGPDGAGGLALETAGGEQRMLFADGGAAPAP